MTDNQVIAPDERALKEHLKTPRFKQGVDGGRWRIVSLDWPIVVAAVSAAPRESAPAEFFLRFELSGYPQAGPTAGLWDPSTGAQVTSDLRPKGDRATLVFRGDWEGGRALYAPWDRVALGGHPDWAQRHSQHAWNSRRDLAFYLANVSELLNAEDYLGV
ncbi:MAG TPA: hypothetical protein VND96_14370 [Candidatus Micrarchaeaceae archaeon]|nr:hypothetical protein [Candidatus Micrarchaeaceae archaeon]